MEVIEKRDLYDENRNLTGETIFKGEDIPEGKYIVVVLVFIQNSEGKFLIQKEVKEKMESMQQLEDIQNLEKIVFREL